MGKKRGGAVCGVGGAVGRERRRVAWAGMAPGAGAAAGRKARRGVGAIAEPWVGVDSSKPPRLFATVVALVAGGGLATLESPKAAAVRTYQAPQGAIPSVAQGVSLGKGEKIHRNPASWRGGRFADAMRDGALWLFFYLLFCNN